MTSTRADAARPDEEGVADPARGHEAGAEPLRCGRWKLKPFELERPVRLGPGGPLTLGQFLAHPDPAVLGDLDRLDAEGLQRLVLARLAGAPPALALSLFGEPGYTMRDVVRHVQEGSPLGVRLIEAERKLVGLLLTEALRSPDDGSAGAATPLGSMA
ncbi:MAG: hypothetical protein IT305_32880 [Chloroflexi bacterium]|nr:hypothetical protein [Chloroflexota bacterium]